MVWKWKPFREVRVACFGRLATCVTALIQCQIKSGFLFLSQAEAEVSASLFSMACTALSVYKVGWSPSRGWWGSDTSGGSIQVFKWHIICVTSFPIQLCFPVHWFHSLMGAFPSGTRWLIAALGFNSLFSVPYSSNQSLRLECYLLWLVLLPLVAPEGWGRGVRHSVLIGQAWVTCSASELKGCQLP